VVGEPTFGPNMAVDVDADEEVMATSSRITTLSRHRCKALGIGTVSRAIFKASTDSSMVSEPHSVINCSPSSTIT
jgi:hypothetical protein